MTTARSARSRSCRRWRSSALLIAAWQLYANLGGLGDDVLPAPSRVLSVTWDNRGDLWANTLPTLRATLLGFALSLAVGLLLAVLDRQLGAPAAGAHAAARRDADAADRRDRAAHGASGSDSA